MEFEPRLQHLTLVQLERRFLTSRIIEIVDHLPTSPT
jgi:hypothetical protein